MLSHSNDFHKPIVDFTLFQVNFICFAHIHMSPDKASVLAITDISNEQREVIWKNLLLSNT